jgi:hypothetical protein
MASIEDLKSWFERDIKFATWEDNVQVDASDPSRTVIRFYTDTNEYSLIITPRDDGELPRVDCAVRARKARAGLANPRVRQLWRNRPHRLNERTWRRVLGAIVGLELVRVHRREAAEQAPELTEEADGSPTAERSAAAD